MVLKKATIISRVKKAISMEYQQVKSFHILSLEELITFLHWYPERIKQLTEVTLPRDSQ